MGAGYAIDKGGLLLATPSMTSAQILNSNTTPVTLIAAPGAGKYIQLISVVCHSKFLTAAYATNLAGRLRYVGSTPVIVSFTAGLILGQAISVFIEGVMQITTTGASTFTNSAVEYFTATGNPTAGGGSFQWYITYLILDVL